MLLMQLGMHVMELNMWRSHTYKARRLGAVPPTTASGTCCCGSGVVRACVPESQGCQDSDAASIGCPQNPKETYSLSSGFVLAVAHFK